MPKNSPNMKEPTILHCFGLKLRFMGSRIV